MQPIYITLDDGVGRRSTHAKTKKTIDKAVIKSFFDDGMFFECYIENKKQKLAIIDVKPGYKISLHRNRIIINK